MQISNTLAKYLRSLILDATTISPHYRPITPGMCVLLCAHTHTRIHTHMHTHKKTPVPSSVNELFRDWF